MHQGFGPRPELLAPDPEILALDQEIQVTVKKHKANRFKKHRRNSLHSLISNVRTKNKKIENCFENSTPYETVANPIESTQILSPGRFRHAERESDVKNLPIRHPDLEMKENNLHFLELFEHV